MVPGVMKRRLSLVSFDLISSQTSSTFLRSERSFWMNFASASGWIVLRWERMRSAASWLLNHSMVKIDSDDIYSYSILHLPSHKVDTRSVRVTTEFLESTFTNTTCCTHWKSYHQLLSCSSNATTARYVGPPKRATSPEGRSRSLAFEARRALRATMICPV